MFGTPIATTAGAGTVPATATVNAKGLDTSTTGQKLTYTCPAGVSALVQAVGYRLVSGTAPTLDYRWIPNGGAIEFWPGTLVSGTILQLNHWLSPGDQAFLNVQAAGAGSTVDATISVVQYSAGGAGGTDNTVFLSLKTAAAVNQGMPLHPGADPILLLAEHIGQAIREEVRGIASNTPVVLTVWDIFEIGCECNP